MLGLDARVQRLIQKIDEADLQFGVEGPCTPWSGECRFLKRKFAGINGSIVIEQDGKHVEKLISLVGVERESGKQTPCPMNPNDVKSVKPLAAEKYPVYRTCIGILLYLGPDRPECLYMIKLLSAKTSCPTEHEWHLLRHLARYLKLHPRRGISLSACNPGRTVEQRWLGDLGPERGPDADGSQPFGSGHLLESISDASWAGESDRRSIIVPQWCTLTAMPSTLGTSVRRVSRFLPARARCTGACILFKRAFSLRGSWRQFVVTACTLFTEWILRRAGHLLIELALEG